MRMSALAIIGALSVAASAQTPLPNMRVLIDGAKSDVAPVVLQLNTFMLPLDKAVAALSEGKAAVSVSGSQVTVTYAGKRLLTTSIVDDGGTTAQLYDALGDGELVREVTLSEPPRKVKVGSATLVMVDVETLREMFGTTEDVDGEEMVLFTPGFWCRRLGLPDSVLADRFAKNVLQAPQVGVTPPASTLLIMARSSTEGYAQMYKFEDGKPIPLLGKDALGGPVVQPDPTSGELPRSVRCTPTLTAVAETMFTGPLPKRAFYAAIFTRKAFDGSDPVDAIKQGQLRDGEWGISGVRQELVDTPVRFSPFPVPRAMPLAAVAKEKGMSEYLLAGLNGLQAGDTVPAGRKLIVIDGFNDQVLAREANPDYDIVGLHEVQPGQTIATLAAAWGAKKEWFYGANPDIPKGAELQPGQLVCVVVGKNQTPPAPSITNTSVEPTVTPGKGLSRESVKVYQRSDSKSPVVGALPKQSMFEITDRSYLPEAMLKIRTEKLVGWVKRTDVTVPQEPKFQSYKPGPVLPGSRGYNSAYEQEGSRYFGTPYVYGGNDPFRGIDCSHFVHHVMRRLNLPVADPPVHGMEAYGELKGWKAGSAEVAGKRVSFSTSNKFANVQPGDLLIMQYASSSSSGHHIGIYIGEVGTVNRRKFGPIKHGLIHSCGGKGPTIYDLDRQYDSIFKYMVTSSSKRGAWYANLSAKPLDDVAFMLRYKVRK